MPCWPGCAIRPRGNARRCSPAGVAGPWTALISSCTATLCPRSLRYGACRPAPSARSALSPSFAVGILPALLVLWIRRGIPESEAFQGLGNSSAPRHWPGVLLQRRPGNRLGVHDRDWLCGSGHAARYCDRAVLDFGPYADDRHAAAASGDARPCHREPRGRSTRYGGLSCPTGCRKRLRPRATVVRPLG